MPSENIQKWLILQEGLLKKTIYVENRIRSCKKEIKALRAKRQNPKKRLSKEESKEIKRLIEAIEFKIEEYRWILLIFQSIGDGIAFTFLHKLDIKPQNFKESSGFISEKNGLVLEKKILHYSFKRGFVAILHDLTSVLKYADVTVITEDGYFPIEAKSSKMNNERIKRQMEKTNKLYKYLVEDEITGLYGDDAAIMRRVELGSQEINYLDKFSKLLDTAKAKGFDSCKFENGFSCLVAYDDFEVNEVLDQEIEKKGFKQPYFFHLNMYKFLGYGYYPFPLSFNNAEHYWNFLEGNLNVMIFIDYSVIEEISDAYGYNVERAQMENYAFTFISQEDKADIKEFSMSEHFFFRTFMEMVSLKWLLTDTFNRLRNKEIK